MKRKTKCLALFVFLLSLSNTLFSQEQCVPVLEKDYYHINKKQKKIIEHYLLAMHLFPEGRIRSKNKLYSITPEILAINKNGEILDFNSYKDIFKEACEDKEKIEYNLVYLNLSNGGKQDEIVMTYTILEPDWEIVSEIIEYEFKKSCRLCEEQDIEEGFMKIRKIHIPPKKIKLNQKKYIIYYINDYE